MPLYKKGRIFALGVEALLAYYGLEEDAVKIDEEFQKFSITHPRHGTLVETYLSDGQFLEVNWFSKWTETLEEKTLTIEAKRAYNDKNVNRYLSLVPKIFRSLLKRIDDVEIPIDDSDLPDCLLKLGIEEKKSTDSTGSYFS